MKTMGRVACTVLLLALANVCVTSEAAAQRQYRDNDVNMRNLIGRIETRTDAFRSALQNALNRSQLNGTAREDEVNGLASDLKSATNQLRSRFENRQSTSTDARLVLDRAALINNFLLSNWLDTTVDQNWRTLRGDLDQLARAYYLTWQWNTVGTVGATADSRTRQLAQRINNRMPIFSRLFRQELNRGGLGARLEIDETRRHLTEFESAAGLWRNRLNNNQSSEEDARNVLEHAAYLNSFLANHQLASRVANDWSSMRQDLDQLASFYNIAWNWDTVPGGSYGTESYLTGTYRLNASQSGNSRTAIEDATRNLPAAQRQRVSDALLARLDAPDMLALQRRGTEVTIASSRAPQTTIVADGREHTETNENGRVVKVRASLSGDQLIIARTGERARDFSVTFDPIGGERRLLVTRRLYTEQLSQPVVLQSYYDKISDIAQLDLYLRNPQYPTTGSTSGDFIIPNGTQLVAQLNTNLSTKTAHDNDRFTMTVRSPSQYDGAILEGYVSNISRGGRITGRSEMTLNFETIRLPDGRSYRFAGILENVRASDESVRVDNEGAVRAEDSQTSRTVTRTAIGTAVGAIIGAIAGGGKGAAIGAVIGAGAGAGSVYVQGRGDLDLSSGTEVVIRTTGPS
jgi:hypothetical protein